MGRSAHIRLYCLLVLATMAVHELRYLLAGGDVAAQSGHGYLSAAGPAFGMTMALLLSALVLRAAAVSAPDRQRARWRRVWPVASAAVFGLFAGQELLENWASTSHPALLGTGGLVALPLSVAAGAVVAFLVRVIDAVVPPGEGWLRGLVLLLPRVASARGAAPTLVAFPPPPRHAAGRGPPASV